MVWRGILGAPRCTVPHTKEYFSVSARRYVPSILRMRRAIPWACLSLIYQVMARIAAASKACGSDHCAIYTNRGEAAAPHLGLPLPLLYFWLKRTGICTLIANPIQCEYWKKDIVCPLLLHYVKWGINQMVHFRTQRCQKYA